MSSGGMTAEDHYAQDALERLTVARLQTFAERSNRAIRATAEAQRKAIAESLAEKGHSWRSLLAGSSKTSAYSSNLRSALPVFFRDLCSTFPDANFEFAFIGTEGRLAQVKGDCEITVEPAVGGQKKLSVSLKNYLNGPQRIQVGSGTFQSFALSFFLLPAGIGRWTSPVDGSECNSGASSFREWRDKQLTSVGGAQIVGLFAQLDQLNTDLRATLIEGEDFRFYDGARVPALQQDIGTRGAGLLKQIIDLVPTERSHARLLKSTGLLDGEDLLVFGKGVIADTITDPNFAAFVERLRHAILRTSVAGQTLRFVFSTPQSAGASSSVVLTIDVPCTINTNGAWFRDGEPYEGTRHHAKERRDLQWGERRPKKSREIATSVNTYLDLSATGVLRRVTDPAVAQ